MLFAIWIVVDVCSTHFITTSAQDKTTITRFNCDEEGGRCVNKTHSIWIPNAQNLTNCETNEEWAPTWSKVSNHLICTNIKVLAPLWRSYLESCILPCMVDVDHCHSVRSLWFIEALCGHSSKPDSYIWVI